VGPAHRPECRQRYLWKCISAEFSSSWPCGALISIKIVHHAIFLLVKRAAWAMGTDWNEQVDVLGPASEHRQRSPRPVALLYADDGGWFAGSDCRTRSGSAIAWTVGDPHGRRCYSNERWRITSSDYRIYHRDARRRHLRRRDRRACSPRDNRCTGG